jgi:hypothetical protein
MLLTISTIGCLDIPRTPLPGEEVHFIRVEHRGTVYERTRRFARFTLFWARHVHPSKVTRQLARGSAVPGDGEQGRCRIQIPTTSGLRVALRCDGPAVSYPWIGL